VVDAADRAALAAMIQSRGWPAHATQNGAAMVTGPSAAEIGYAAFAAGLQLTQLATQMAGLEQIFFRLTEGGGLK
jgi:ABC-2 type transport system ATP-binding protein